jgi:hypothetical protein
MKIVNETPMTVFALPGKGLENNTALTVIVKGTFAIEANKPVTLAPEQEPVIFADQLQDPEKGGSPRFEDDIAPFKPRADIVIVGKAIAPEGQPARSLDVGFRVGQITKAIRVIGNRAWRTSGLFGEVSPSEPVPFTEMDLTYENAFGGMDMKWGDHCPENPVGRGIFNKKSKKEELENKILPNLEDPHNLIRSWKDRPKPVGFGYIGKGWSPRFSLLGTYDEKWKKERYPERPDDFKFDFFNAAPLDQQVKGYLRGDERVELIHLSPEGRIQFRLPGVTPTVSIAKLGFGSIVENVAMKLDTLCLMPTDKCFYLVWRGNVPITDITAEEIDRIQVLM